jgi:hypothetical protein
MLANKCTYAATDCSPILDTFENDLAALSRQPAAVVLEVKGISKVIIADQGCGLRLSPVTLG